jgi:hypothetical protein
MVVIEQCDCVCGCRAQDADASVKDTGCQACGIGNHDMVLYAILVDRPTMQRGNDWRYRDDMDIA